MAIQFTVCWANLGKFSSEVYHPTKFLPHKSLPGVLTGCTPVFFSDRGVSLFSI